MRLFWTLPGPRSFLESIESHLRSGRSVVIMVPSHGPGEFRREVKRLASDWPWNQITPSEAVPPAEQVYEKLLPNSLRGRVRNARSFANEEALRACVVWIEGATATNWAAWNSFLAEYEEACRNRESHKRCLFVVLLEGSLALKPPPEEMTLAHCVWRGMVSELDTLLYAGVLLKTRTWEDRPPGPRQLLLLASTVAKVALWDPWLARSMVERSPTEILEPSLVLKTAAADRGWGAGTVASWEDGSIEWVDGQARTHSALFAAQGDSAGEISVRRWSAQASILLPLVEEQRRAVLSRIGPSIRLPQHFDTGPVERLEDLEIGQLAYLTYKQPFGLGMAQRIRRLRDIRNHLSHLEPLDPGTALSPELYQL